MKKIWSHEDILRGSQLSRRGLLKGAAAASAAFAGPFIPNAAFAADKTLQVMAWEGWDNTVEMADWIKQEGITIESTVMGNQDDVTTKFNVPSPPPFDAAEYNQGYADLYIDKIKITKPLDRNKLPNYNKEDMFDMFYEKPTWYRNGELYGLPVGWGINTISYNPKMMEKPLSYTDLLKPELKGKIVIVDDTLATWPVAATLAGFGDKFPNLTKEEMTATLDHLKQYRAQARVISLTYGDVVSLMVSGEVAAMFSGWTGIPTETAKQGVETIYTIPKEGAATWCDAWFMPKSVDNEDLAYEYLNRVVDPEVQAKIAIRNVSGVTNRKAVDLLDAPTKALFDYSNIDAVFAKAPLLGIPPLESSEFATYADWQAAWNDFKAG
jgi:spermidine/putrescine-binding protein